MLKAVCLIHFKPRLSIFFVGAIPINGSVDKCWGALKQKT